MSECKWVGSDRPRIIPERHLQECQRETCDGCQPCDRAHCRDCGVQHAAGVCPTCLDASRTNIDEILRMVAGLREEVEHRGVDSEAMNLLGPVADPEQWAARGIYAAAGRIVLVGCDAKDERGLHDWLDKADHELHPLTILGTWEMVVRDAYGHETDALTSVTGAAAYLDTMLGTIGADENLPWDDFARDLRRCVGHMERVLHDGEQIERGAPCPDCGRNLTHRYGKQPREDAWICTTRTCDVQAFTVAQYRGWVEDDARENADRLNAEDMALRFAGLKASAVRVWGSRGLVRKRGKDQRGMTLYDVEDVQARLALAESA